MPCVYLPGPAPAVTVANSTDCVIIERIDCTYLMATNRMRLNRRIVWLTMQ